MKTISERLQEAMNEAGLSQTELATKAGYKSQGAIGNVLSRGNRPVRLHEVAQALGVRAEWLEKGALPKRAWTDAHPVSEIQPTLPSKRELKLVEWRQMANEKLSGAFAVIAPDDAMSPVINKGMLCEVDTTVRPENGDLILLRDVEGDFYLRYFVEAPRKQWEAHAAREGFAKMYRERDGLEIVGPVMNVHRKRSG